MPLLLEHTRTCRLETLVLFFNLFLLSGLLSGCSNDNNATIYTAQAIITMNPQQPRAEAIAVLNGKIEAVGDLATVTAAVAHHNPQKDIPVWGTVLEGKKQPIAADL